LGITDGGKKEWGGEERGGGRASSWTRERELEKKRGKGERQALGVLKTHKVKNKGCEGPFKQRGMESVSVDQ